MWLTIGFVTYYVVNIRLSSSHVQMRELDNKEGRVQKNWYLQTVVLEKTLESTLDSKEIKPVNLKGNQPCILFGRTDTWNSNTLGTWCEQLTHWKRLQCTERLKAEGEEGDRGWNGWMASQVQWTWIWANSGSRLGTGKPGMLQCVG